MSYRPPDRPTIEIATAVRAVDDEPLDVSPPIEERPLPLPEPRPKIDPLPEPEPSLDAMSPPDPREEEPPARVEPWEIPPDTWGDRVVALGRPSPPPPSRDRAEPPEDARITARTEVPVEADQTGADRAAVERPEPLAGNRPPRYPQFARDRRWTGVAFVRLVVSDEGHVVRATLVSSSGHDLLDEAALEAVRTWEFRPARRAGRPIEVTIELPIRFRLTPRVDA